MTAIDADEVPFDEMSEHEQLEEVRFQADWNEWTRPDQFPDFVPQWMAGQVAAERLRAAGSRPQRSTPEPTYNARTGKVTPAGPLLATNDTDPADVLEVVDWVDLYAGINHEEPIVDGLLFRGRWTAAPAPAKTGKSSFAMAVSVALATGHHPFTGQHRDPVRVLYLDAEMGRVDFHERLEDDFLMGPTDLGNLAYVDLVPTLNRERGALQLLAWAVEHEPAVVVIDGLNGAVEGPEKDDETWRPFYALTVAPLKRAGIAVLTCDNLGKDTTLGPRGSSVKVDKPDAVIQLKRTDDGVRLTTTHRRTAAYPLSTDLTVTGLDTPGELVTYRYSSSSWPHGTADKARELDQVGAPLDISNRNARQALKVGGFTPGKNDVLAAAIRYRNTPERIARITTQPAGNAPGNAPTTTSGER